MITALEPVVPPPDDDAPTGLSADHPMRLVTRTVAFDPDGWTAATRRQVAELFDSLADEWNSRDVPGREAPLVDALDRGLAGAPAPAGGRTTCIDIGAGTGLYSRILGPRFPTLLSVDLALEMLRNAPAVPAARVQADASCLPVPDGAVDVLVLANAFLFPAEVERVLAAHGAVVWVNSRGTDTPIHLLAEEVDSALPGAWSGVSSTAGWGTWSTHWRAA